MQEGWRQCIGEVIVLGVLNPWGVLSECRLETQALGHVTRKFEYRNAA